MPIPVIIDTDPGVDDVIAILFALASPEIEILGFIVSFGNTDIDSSYANILKLYDTLARHFEKYPNERQRFPNFDSRPFLARGPQGPLEGELHSAQYFHGRDGLGDISTRHPEITTGSGAQYLQVTEKPGDELALDLIRAHPPRAVTYIALGPLTNLALMARKDPRTCRERLGRVVSMGGALDVPGNTSPVAEFNYFADPFAVKELLITSASSAPKPIPLSRILILPLDITTPHELPFPYYTSHIDPHFQDPRSPPNDYLKESRSPLAHFTSAFLERTREVMLEFGKDAMELHDVVAVWCAMQNPPALHEDEQPSAIPKLTEGWGARRRLFQVERYGEHTRGMLIVDRRDETTTYDPGDNRAEVQAALERAVHDPSVPAQVESASKVETIEHTGLQGIPCITRTPGPKAILDSMITRIWGK